MIVAEQLGGFIPYIGGTQYAHVLVPTLEALCATEEPLLRDKAVENFNKIARQLSKEELKEKIVPAVERLATAQWFSSRVASTGLFEVCFQKLNEGVETPAASDDNKENGEADADADSDSVDKDMDSDDIQNNPSGDAGIREHLLSLYMELTQHESPAVRRASATYLPKIIKTLPNLKLEGKVFQMFILEATDEQDSVRFLSIDILISIAEVLSNGPGGISEEQNHELLESAISLATDQSWRVRYVVADRFAKLASILKSDQMKQKFVGIFVDLMQDQEVEVRTAISMQISGFCKTILELSPQVTNNTNKEEPRNENNSIILDDILPNVRNISNDASKHVRASIALEITNLAAVLGPSITSKYIFPIFLDIIVDKDPEVRINFISNLSSLEDLEIIGTEKLTTTLIPAITELSQDKTWRIRLSAIKEIPKLAAKLGIAFFNKDLGDLCINWLWDPVYSIRIAAIENLCQITQIFGSNWTKNEILVPIITNGHHNNFIYRLTSLLMITKITESFMNIKELNNVEETENFVKKSIFNFISELIDDSIPNIRFNVAKSYLVIANVLFYLSTKDLKPNDKKQEVLKFVELNIISSLQKLELDKDIDVQFFGSKSLEGINEIFKKHGIDKLIPIKNSLKGTISYDPQEILTSTVNVYENQSEDPMDIDSVKSLNLGPNL